MLSIMAQWIIVAERSGRVPKSRTSRRCSTNVLEGLWQTAVAQRYELAAGSAVPLLNEALIAYEKHRGK